MFLFEEFIINISFQMLSKTIKYIITNIKTRTQKEDYGKIITTKKVKSCIM